ncbi:unnamed protein product, partial [Rotaria sp. Silwood2]
MIVKQRPWSEWKRTDESCIQHTGHDIEQIQQLYSMCEESLIRYRSHTKEQHADDNIIPYLSPINLPVATLCNYFLTEVINILHACVYPELISLPVNMASKRTPHGPEQHHKLIVDSTFIANPEPYDSDRRKMYYHSKSPTNYA